MASTFLVADLLTDAARMANVPAFASTTNVTDTQATYWIVQSARTLSARLRQAFGDDADYLRQQTLTTQAGLNFVSLPQNAGEIHAVLWAKTSSDYRLLRNATLDDLVELQEGDPTDWSQGPAPLYRLEGETLGFYPGSTTAQNVIIFYTGHLSIDLDVSDYYAARLDADRWITLDVACRVLLSQGRDANALTQEKMLLEAQLFNPARRRQPNKTVSIRDVRGAAIRDAISARWRR